MKTLGKLNINPEKVLKDDELKNLRGGDWYGRCIIYCEGGEISGYGYGSSPQAAANALADRLSWCNGLLIICGY